MQNRGWIVDSGSTHVLKDIIEKSKNGLMYYIAMYADSFNAGKVESWDIDSINYDKLLEIRIFNNSKELLARRSMLGNQFEYRIACEENIAEDEYYCRTQTLDINRDKDKTYMNSYGDMMITSITGGHYKLPIDTSKNSIKIINYVAYDDEGIGNVVDARLCDFV